MVVKSYGKKRGTRNKLTLREIITVNTFLEKFKEGEKVNVKLSTNNNIPHPRFHGKTGVVLGKRGRAYIIQLRDKNKVKQIIARPEHLRRAG